MIRWLLSRLLRRICSLCDGTGHVHVDFREHGSYRQKCCVCAGKGRL